MIGTYPDISGLEKTIAANRVTPRKMKGQTMADQLQTALAILRRKQVEARTGLSRSAIYALMARNEFPRPVRLTAKAVGWKQDCVDAWINSRVEVAA